ncbi:MAG TPA: SRPBCC family protein [Ilumatobacter sp.]|nr:SRPBCC family protein [Ilumatobacter sp.]
MTNEPSTHYDTEISADPKVPSIHIERVFDATPEQLFRAHTDPAIVPQWLGPRGVEMDLVVWDCRTGGEFRYVHRLDDAEYGFYGCFHEVSPTKLVQTFTFEGFPDGVSLETMTFEDLGDGRTKLHAVSLCASFEERDQWLASGMEEGVNQGYERIDELVAAGTL